MQERHMQRRKNCQKTQRKKSGVIMRERGADARSVQHDESGASFGQEQSECRACQRRTSAMVAANERNSHRESEQGRTYGRRGECKADDPDINGEGAGVEAGPHIELQTASIRAPSERETSGAGLACESTKQRTSGATGSTSKKERPGAAKKRAGGMVTRGSIASRGVDLTSHEIKGMNCAHGRVLRQNVRGPGGQQQFLWKIGPGFLCRFWDRSCSIDVAREHLKTARQKEPAEGAAQLGAGGGEEERRMMGSRANLTKISNLTHSERACGAARNSERMAGAAGNPKKKGLSSDTVPFRPKEELAYLGAQGTVNGLTVYLMSDMEEGRAGDEAGQAFGLVLSFSELNFTPYLIFLASKNRTIEGKGLCSFGAQKDCGIVLLDFPGASRVGPWNLSQASLTLPEALAGLRNLRTTNPALHAALTQTSETDPTSEKPDHGDSEDPYQGADVYDDCDVPLEVVSAHLASGHGETQRPLRPSSKSRTSRQSLDVSSSKIVFEPSENFKKVIVHSLGVTVTPTKIVPFRGLRHPPPEPLVETLQPDIPGNAFLPRHVSAELEKEIAKLAKATGMVAGKGMLFPTVEEVNETWALVANATANNRLGIGAKIATAGKEQSDRSRLICVYTRDFTDKEDVERVLLELVRIGCVPAAKGHQGNTPW
ncbi:hypothetical protein C8R45DRAFT_922675 [Mycena sanguinolenta]|nr:hypothetical protein C8R45DRAFT_922675 [Mycena sanguinolenta]